MVANVGVAVGIWSQVQFVQLLFSFSVSAAPILIFSSWPKSDNVRKCPSMSKYLIHVGKAENKGTSLNRGAISHRSKVISASGLMAAILDFGSRQRRAMFSVT